MTSFQHVTSPMSKSEATGQPVVVTQYSEIIDPLLNNSLYELVVYFNLYNMMNRLSMVSFQRDWAIKVSFVVIKLCTYGMNCYIYILN